MRIVIAILWLLHWLPLPVLGRIGEAIGSLCFTLLRSRRRIALTNLRLCLPELSEEARKKLAKKHFQDYARSLFERSILWWSSEARLQSLMQIDPEIPLDAFKAGPIILLCPHFVCLDVAGIAISMRASACSMYSRQRNKVFDEALRKGRLRFGDIKLFSRNDGVKPIIRAMRSGLPFFMLPDMDFGIKDAEFVPFFGIPAATLTATARIAAATGAKVIPVIATFLPNYRGWKIKFYPAWENYPGDDMLAATRHMNAFIEERVRETPAEYLWTHKRFKTRPAGLSSVYSKSAPDTLPGPD